MIDDLTIWDIETGLADLIAQREEIAERYEATRELTGPMTSQDELDTLDELDACDLAIRAYVTAEVQKADGITAYIRREEALAEAAYEEIQRLSDLKYVREQRAKNLREIVLRVMQETGKTRIEGRHSVLSIKKNPPAVDIAQPDLVPDEQCKFTLTLNCAEYDHIIDCVDEISDMFTPETLTTRLKREPQKSLIAPVLKRGEAVAGCRMVQNERLVIE